MLCKRRPNSVVFWGFSAFRYHLIREPTLPPKFGRRQRRTVQKHVGERRLARVLKKLELDPQLLALRDLPNHFIGPFVPQSLPPSQRVGKNAREVSMKFVISR